MPLRIGICRPYLNQVAISLFHSEKMIRFSAIVLVFALHLCSAREKKHYFNIFEDYCWRDYNGIVPSDALKGGVDNRGRPIYIGQVLYDNKLIPGKIHENDDKIHFEYYEAFSANETLKILCTPYPERFEWMSVSYYEVFHITTKHLFEGGYEKGYTIYVGRAESHGETTVGKVVCSPTNCIRLTTIENGTWYDHDEFEILTYNPYAIKESTPGAESSGFVPYLLLFLMVISMLLLLFFVLRKC